MWNKSALSIYGIKNCSLWSQFSPRVRVRRRRSSMVAYFERTEMKWREFDLLLQHRDAGKSLTIWFSFLNANGLYFKSCDLTAMNSNSNYVSLLVGRAHCQNIWGVRTSTCARINVGILTKRLHINSRVESNGCDAFICVIWAFFCLYPRAVLHADNNTCRTSWLSGTFFFD